MGAPKIVSIIISGVDRFTNVSGKALKGLDALQNRMQKMGTGFSIGGGSLALGGMGLARVTGLTELPGQLVKAERNLVSLGNVGELTAQQLKPIGDEVFRLQRITNQTQGELFQGLNTLVAAGLDPQIAQRFLSPIGKAATAEDAEIGELAQTTFTLYDNLQVPINDLSKALNIMTLAGKRGRFELKHMAREFPALSASARILGLSNQQGTGKLTGSLRSVSQMSAALQIAMKGAGTQEQAANNMANFYQKVFSNETMGQMKKITGSPMTLINVWSKALKDGEDPMEKTIAFLDKLTNLGDPSKKAAAIGKIFTDRQVQDFVKIMMPNLREYAKLRDEWANMPGSQQDIIGRDFERIMKTTAEQMKLFKINLATVAAPNLEGPLSKANALFSALNKNALVTKGIFVSIVGMAAGGIILLSLGAIAFSLQSIVGLFGSALTTAMLFKSAWGGILVAAKALLPVALALGSAFMGIKIGDGLAKSLFGYKVGLMDIISHGGYQNALEAQRKDELRANLRKLYPNMTDERLEALVARSGQKTEIDSSYGPQPDTGENFIESPAPKKDPFQAAFAGYPMGSAYYATLPASKQSAEVKVTFVNPPPGTKVTTEKSKGMNLNTDLGPTYR